MPSHSYLAYRRNARAAAAREVVKESKELEKLKRAQDDFAYFCEYVADKPPATHHKEWHRHFITNEDSSCLLKIAGPNVAIIFAFFSIMRFLCYNTTSLKKEY